MLDYSTIINHIRQNTNCFKAVAGGVSVDSFQVTTNSELPSAFVVPLSLDSERNEIDTSGLMQRSTEHFGVIVSMATGDLRGQQASLLIPMFRTALMSALLNWYPETTHSVQGLYYEGDEFLLYDSGRTFWMFRYALDLQLTEDDGWQIDYPTLDSIKINVLVNPEEPVTPVDDSQPEIDIVLYPPHETNVIEVEPKKPTITVR